ncbi:MAG: uncharacterized protein A8A55_0950 [Amphiamblys sp. WSBS2006]|nr:MAG: uncharacterized protein A8A55_0950 [Amphiamblys sp. WSBS2006]
MFVPKHGEEHRGRILSSDDDQLQDYGSEIQREARTDYKRALDMFTEKLIVPSTPESASVVNNENINRAAENTEMRFKAGDDDKERRPLGDITEEYRRSNPSNENLDLDSQTDFLSSDPQTRETVERRSAKYFR